MLLYIYNIKIQILFTNNAKYHEFLSKRVPSHCALTGAYERYNNCVFLKFED